MHDNFKEVVEKLQEIQISNAVTHEKLEQANLKLMELSVELHKQRSRIDKHDKIAGAMVIAVAMLGALVKFKVI